MRLNTIKPSEGSKKEVRRVGAELVRVLEKRLEEAIKDKNLEQVVSIKLDLRADKCLYREGSQKEVLSLCLSLIMLKLEQAN